MIDPPRAPARTLSTGQAHGALLLYTLLISASFPLGRLVAAEVDPFVVTFLRFAMGAAVYGAVFSARSRNWGQYTIFSFRGPPRREENSILSPISPGALVRYGMVATPMAVFFIAMFEALRWADPLSAGAIFTLLPLISAGYALVFLRERLSGRLAVLILIGALGALWVLFRGSLARLLALDFGYGETIFLLGCFAFAAHPVAVKRLHGGEAIAHLTFGSLVVGTVLLGLVSAPRLLETPWAAISGEAYLAILFLGIVNTALTFYLSKSASVVLTPAKVMAYTFLIPGLVALLEGLFGQAWPAPTVYIGVAITTGAMLAMLKVE